MKWNFTSKDMYKPTIEEREENRKFLDKCEEAGLNIGVFSEEFIYDEDDILAFTLISEGKEVPEELKKKLKAKKIPENDYDFDFDMSEIDEEIKKKVGDKFK